MLGSIFLALRAPRGSVLVAGALIFAASQVILRTVGDEFGCLTDPIFVLAFWSSTIVWSVMLIGLLRLAFGGLRLWTIVVIMTFGIFGFAARTILMDTGGYFARHLYLPTARLLVNGKPYGGYVHSLSWDAHRVLVVTWRSRFGRESYWVWNSTRSGQAPGAVHCKNWTAPPFPVFFSTDTNQPCLSFEPEATPRNRHIKFETNFVEFTADDSRKVRVVW